MAKLRSFPVEISERNKLFRLCSRRHLGCRRQKVARIQDFKKYRMALPREVDDEWPEFLCMINWLPGNFD